MFGRRHHEPHYWRATWALINAGIGVMLVGDLAGLGWVVGMGWLLQSAAFFAYGADLVAAGLFDRRTMRDPALQAVGLSLAFLSLGEGLGTYALFGHQPRQWVAALLAYGLGWLGLSFMGFGQKLLPFLIWLHRYAHGKGKSPRLEDIWRPSWGYGPVMAVTFGLAALLFAYWCHLEWLVRTGYHFSAAGLARLLRSRRACAVRPPSSARLTLRRARISSPRSASQGRAPRRR